MDAQGAAGADTSITTPAAPAAPAGPAPGASTGAAPAAPAWSLDTWKDDDWDSLPERIRSVADRRYQGQYEPKLTAAQNAVATHQREVAEAKAALRAAEASQLKGDPYGAQDVKDAKAALAKAQGDFDAYRKEWNPERFEAHKADLQKRWTEAQAKGNEQWNQALDEELGRNLRFQYPWYGEKNGEAANPSYNAEKTTTAKTLATDPLFADAGLPDAYFLTAAELNKAQLHGLITALAGGQDPYAALEAARRPPKHEPSPAARASGGGGQRPAPRPEDGVPRRPGAPSTRKSWDAAVDQTQSRTPNAR